MKNLLCLILLMPVFILKAQDSLFVSKKGTDTLYTTSGFKVYVGQELKIGTGGMPDGDFKYIRKNAASLLSYYSNTGYQGLANSANALSRRNSGLKFKVIRIDERGNKKHGFVYYPIIAAGGRYEIDIDNAISAGEIEVPEKYKPSQKPLEVRVTQQFSISDEIMKLKKLRDDSLITEEEYQQQKKKLLDNK